MTTLLLPELVAACSRRFYKVAGIVSEVVVGETIELIDELEVASLLLREGNTPSSFSLPLLVFCATISSNVAASSV